MPSRKLARSNGRDRRGGRLIAMVVVAVTVAGCGGSTRVPSTWVSGGETSASYIAWTEDGGRVSGQIEIASADGSPAEGGGIAYVSSTSEVRQLSFDGTIGDGRVTLVVSNGTTWTGTVSSTALTLDVPQAEGPLRTGRWAPGTSEDYNAAAAGLALPVDYCWYVVRGTNAVVHYDAPDASAVQCAQFMVTLRDLGASTEKIDGAVSAPILDSEVAMCAFTQQDASVVVFDTGLGMASGPICSDLTARGWTATVF